MKGESYFDAAIAALSQARATQAAPIRLAAELMTEAIVAGQSLYSFGASHSFITTEELVYRTGGLMLINPIYPHGMNLFVRPLTATSAAERVVGLGVQMLESSPARPGDVLLLTSTSGRNAVIIDMALTARRKGIKTIGLTALAYTSGVSSRHPSGKKLAELCDVVIDNCVPYGDAAIAIEGLEQKVGPLSTVTGCAIVNELVVSVVRNLVARGVEPPVFVSANVDGGDERNARLLAENRHRIHYMD
ncbi:MAG: SIS domain-containing protein [Verrucomicrobiota bacterium]